MLNDKSISEESNLGIQIFNSEDLENIGLTEEDFYNLALKDLKNESDFVS